MRDALARLLDWLRSPMPAPARVRVPARVPVLGRRSRGQALIEFALTAAVMVTLVLTTLSVPPAITARGVVLDTAATLSERATRFLAPDSATGSTDRAILCNALGEIARQQLSGGAGGGGLSSLPVAGSNNVCVSRTALNPVWGSRNPVVSVTPMDSAGRPMSTNTRLLPGQRVEVCLAYTWRPNGGLFWLTMNGPFGVARDMTYNLFTFRYCGQSVIHENRTR